MSSTNRAPAAIPRTIPAWHPTSGTDLAYAATRVAWQYYGCSWRGRISPTVLRRSYAMPGTEIGYAATRSGAEGGTVLTKPLEVTCISAYEPATRCPVLT
eukprot:2548261-Rhodomonas_salina.1